MKSQIIQIGNSQGIRIPKALLEDSRIKGEVELELHSDGILIRRAEKVREGWEVAFRAISDSDDDEVIDSTTATVFDRKEWQW